MLHQRRWWDLVRSANQSTHAPSSQRFTSLKSAVARRSAAASAKGARIAGAEFVRLIFSICSERVRSQTRRSWLGAADRKRLRTEGSPRCPALRFSTSERIFSRRVRAGSRRDIRAACGQTFGTASPACLSQSNTSWSRCRTSTIFPSTRMRVLRKSSARCPARNTERGCEVCFF